MADAREGELLRRLARGDLSREELLALLHSASARRHHTVRRALAAHPATPRPDALALIPTLFWRDLAWISAEARAHPEIRRASDKEILRRLPALALSERAAIAGLAGPGIVRVLRATPDPDVLRALLDNRYATETDVTVAAAGAASPNLLGILLEHAKWGRNRAVRGAAVLNPRTPSDWALQMLPELSRDELREVAAGVGLAPSLREEARREMARRLEAAASLS